MKPAISLILFTVLSGFGFGLLFWLNLNLHSAEMFSDIVIFPIAFIVSVVGLIASSFHLGNPQRALLAFTQWRSSWLSREAVLAVTTLLTSFFHVILIVFYQIELSWLGYVASVFCLATIFSTAMIYTQMKTVPRWNMKITPMLFLLYGIAGSSVVLNQIIFSGLLFLVLGLGQIFTWKIGDKQFEKSSHIGTATGLSTNRTSVRMLEPPHTGSNYLLKEMVHIVAQKHIHKLRWISLTLLSLLPTLLCFSFIMITNPSLPILILIALLNFVGTIVSRWLFFSEAEHVVGLYYDR
jgi:sulfite dehydrogenase (quinone) subunit SoeC